MFNQKQLKMKTFCKYSLSGGGNFNPTNTLIKGFLSLLFITTSLTACNDADEAIPTQATKLNIDVQTAKIETRGLIESATLPDGDAHSIGLMLVDEGGATYDNRTYNNVKVTPSTVEGKQVWTPASDIALSSTTGTLYGYYPYNSSVTDFTQVPIAVDDTDYMYATPVEKLDDGNYHAAVTMKHALAAIRLNIVKGTYTGTGAVSSVSVSGDNIATSGKLNAKTGALTSLSGTGSAVTNSTAFTLSTTTKQIDCIIVPVTNTSAAPTITMTIDGKEYIATPSAVTLEQGSVYQYTLTVDSKDISLSDVTVGDWGYNDSGNPVIHAGYNITLSGNIEGIAFSNTVNDDGSVTVTAVPEDYSKYVGAITFESTATVYSHLNSQTGIRSIYISQITDDITITFSGLKIPVEGTIDFTTAESGVYAVAKNGKGVAAADADESCMGVALIVNDATTPQKYMIEKYEYANANTYKETYVEFGATNTEYKKFQAGASGSYGNTNQLPGTYNTVVRESYLREGTPYLINSYTTWNGVYKGVSNSEIIKTITTGYSTTVTYPPMGLYLNNFCNSDNKENQGFTNWYIPSLGEMGLIALNASDINNVLAKIDGTKMSGTYWTCDFFESMYAWYVQSSNRICCNDSKGYRSLGYNVRLIRNL